MAYEMRDGGGTIFKNKYKQDGDRAPEYRGEVMWRGEKIEVALWVKEGQQGKFFSAKLQEPRAKAEQAPPPRQPAPRVMPKRADMDDEIPFAAEFR